MSFLFEQTDAEQQDLAARTVGTNLPLLTLSEGVESWHTMNRFALVENTHRVTPCPTPLTRRIDAGVNVPACPVCLQGGLGGGRGPQYKTRWLEVFAESSDTLEHRQRSQKRWRKLSEGAERTSLRSRELAELPSLVWTRAAAPHPGQVLPLKEERRKRREESNFWASENSSARTENQNQIRAL